jgi:hypothetical protein
MAIKKLTTASSGYIVSPNTTATTATFISEPIVSDGKLVNSYRITNPGVFTQGTAPEGTASNPNEDSNG